MKKNLLLAVCIGLVFAVQAQDKVLTYQDAIKIGIRNSYLLNQQKNNLEFNQMQKLSSMAGLGPTLSANVNTYQVNGNTFNQNTGQVVNGLFDQVNGSLNANLNLFNGFSQVNRLKQSASQLDAQSFYLMRTSQDALNTISTQYLTVLLDVELLRIARENHSVQLKQLDQIKESVNVGSKSPVDEYNQLSQTKAAELRALQAEITLLNDKSKLSLTLLLDPNDKFEVARPHLSVNDLDTGDIALTALEEVALKNRGDYLRAVKTEEAAKYGKNSSRANMLPSLGAFGTLYSAYNHTHGDPNVRPFETQFKSDNLRKVYGLQLTIPILGGNQNLQYRTGYVQQKVNYLNSQLERQNAEIQVKTDVFQAYQNFELYKKTYSVTQSQLEAAQEAYRLENERYNLGITNFVDYSNANKALVQAQTDHAQAEFRLLFQKILLDYAIGTLKVEDLEK
jgi:outer membrane protein